MSTRRTAAEELFDAIRSRWPLIAVVALATALMAWLLATMQPNRYRASAIAAVTPATEGYDTDQIRTVQVLDQKTFIATIAALAETPVVENAAVRPGEHGYSVRAVVLPNTNLLRIDVDGGDPARAADIANRVAPLLSAQARRIFRIYSVTAVSPAASADLIFPRTGRVIAAGIVIGLFLGSTAAWAAARRSAQRRTGVSDAAPRA
ncbi:MAG TPA: Wzz/FepE/Etk N-terminal domain-containing protein [Thermoanaerobaculia bacterium]|nr:Wzz/FepE/Etk N-terminal domain-containing protein [Thermoanaerobaculia bacterium]